MSSIQKVKADITAIAKKCGRDPSEVTLLAVTKGHSWEEIKPLYDAGQRLFGESRQQEAQHKMRAAPDDCEWHFIGSLQKNKVRKVIGHLTLIHSVDTAELARKISECSQEIDLVTPILLQVNVSGEKTKHGLDRDAWRHEFEKVKDLPGLDIKGFMTMAPLDADEICARACFSQLRNFRDELGGSLRFPCLSMGMSHDYPWAIAEGATLLRIGSALFE